MLSYLSVVMCQRSLLHHFLAIIVNTFPENRELDCVIIVHFMMNVNSRLRSGLQIVFICLHITPSHYHHCANLSEDISLIKWLSDIFCRVSKIKHIMSVIHYTICVGLCVFGSPIPFWWLREYISSVLSSLSNRSMNYYPLLRIRSWNNGVRCMSFYIIMQTTPQSRENMYVIQFISPDFGLKCADKIPCSRQWWPAF